MLLNWRNCEKDEWLRHIISIHFNHSFGTPYWIKKESELGINAVKEIQSVEDLYILGQTPEEDLAITPVEEFMPKYFADNKPAFFTAESGGTTGIIKTTAYRVDEFRAAFSDFFRVIALSRNFPGHLNWLFAGPSGPHIIYRSAIDMAVSFGSMQPFAIDFDPRWAKKLPHGSMPFERYRAHILEQALRVIHIQNIGILFSTPDLAIAIGEAMHPLKRNRIRGIHIGGLPLTPESYEKIEALFHNAVIIPGYGNTLFGLTLEIEPHDKDYNVVYYPPGPRLIIDICDLTDSRRMKKTDYGKRGRVVAHRLDEAFFIPNLIERDSAVRMDQKAVCTSPLDVQDGIQNPMPAADYRENYIQEGLY
ncbi:MAG: hypothetical protein HZA77_06635 [Candidatus Schekmanbacteria bacterium]|nr:hypothetical protein [Candidatus Schekmanbacteria bacterium]